MSWSVSATFTRQQLMAGADMGTELIRKFVTDTNWDDAETGPKSVDAPIKGQVTGGTGFEALKALQFAVQAAVNTIGALGDNWLEIGISLSGHSNPFNQVKPGWANDSVSTQVWVVAYLPTDEDADEEDETAEEKAFGLPRLSRVA